MELNSLDQSHGGSYAGDAQLDSCSQRLRHSLVAIFESPALQLADSPNSQLSDLRLSLRQVSTEARQSGLRAEQLLVLIKEVWSGLPGAAVRAPSMHGDERLNYVISTCVDEYYGHIPLGNEGAP